MFFAARTHIIALLVVALLYACGPRQAIHAPGGPASLMDFIEAYNAHALAQTYLEDGRQAEAVAEYERSLGEFNRLDATARALLQDEYGLSREQVERDLAAARALAQGRVLATGNTIVPERLRERMLAEFHPYGHGTPTRGDVAPGTEITSETWKVARDLLPPEILKAVADGHLTIHVQETTDLPPSEEYITATLDHENTVRLTSDEELDGYVAGRPFPLLDANDPQAGFKAAWNLRYRDAGDRLEQWSDISVLNRQGDTQRTFEFYDARAFGMYRARPQYNVPEWEQDGVVSKEFSEIPVLSGTDPFSHGGGQQGRASLALRYRYTSDHRPIGQWMYAAIARQHEVEVYDPERSIFDSTLLMADLVGEEIPTHNWHLIAAPVALVPGFVRNQHARFGGTGGGYPLDPWELRQVYVVEMVLRSPSHPYSRKLFYLDQQTFVPFYELIFNREHVHWRTMFFSYGNPQFSSENRDVQVPILLGQSWIDYQSGFTTLSLVNRALYNHPLSLQLFTFSGLLKRGK